MNEPNPRIYLDHAATSWPKDDAVLLAANRFAKECGAAAGRGGYQSAVAADQVVATTRKSIASLINAESSQCVSLHPNGTAALNAAIHGILRHGDHVVTTAAEHNSVLRPLHHLESSGTISMTVVPTDDQGAVDPTAVLDATDSNTRLVTLTHASNVTGYVQSIAEVGCRLRERSTIFLCDAAQTFGSLPIDVRRWGIDLLAAPGHKGSGGPLGTGFLYAAEPVHCSLNPWIQGGTGSQSESLAMPENMPAKLEAGNLNVPALAGWNAGLDPLLRGEIKTRIRALSALANQLHQGLVSVEGVRLFGHPRSLPIASIAIEGYSASDAALILDSEFGIETRAGLHCAALIHEHLGSEIDGTLRISAGHNTTAAEIDTIVDAIRVICQNQSDF